MIEIPTLVDEHFDLSVFFLQVLEQHIAQHQSGNSLMHIPQAEAPTDDPQWDHFHMVPEIFFQIGGSTHFSFPHQQQQVHGGELLIVPRHLAHQEQMQDEQQAFCNIVVIAYPDRLSFHITMRDGVAARIQTLKLESIRSVRSLRIMSCLDEIIYSANTESRYSGETVAALQMAMLTCMYGIIDNRHADVCIGNSKIDQCLEFIDYNLGNSELSVNLLAQWLQCHPDYLSKLFHQEQGSKLTAFINERRLTVAREALHETSLPIAQIARASGFQDPAYFSRLFKKHVHCTPLQYRQHSDLCR